MHPNNVRTLFTRRSYACSVHCCVVVGTDADRGLLCGDFSPRQVNTLLRLWRFSLWVLKAPHFDHRRWRSANLTVIGHIGMRRVIDLCFGQIKNGGTHSLFRQ